MFGAIRSYAAPVLLAAGLHAALIWYLVVGVTFVDEEARVIKPRVINSSLIVMEPQRAQPKPRVEAPPPAPAAAPPVREDRVDPRLLESQRREAEAAERKRIQIERDKRRKETEDKKLREREREQREARAQAEAARAERLKAEAERAERLRRERLEALASSSFSKALEDEADALAEDEAARVAQTFFQAIRSKIVANWSRPASARNGMKATLRVELVPSGEVAGVSLVESSGDGAFDRSAEMAVRRAGQFSVPDDPALFERRFRRFNLLFNPEDLLR
ncbi:MAG: cell envelope integrity protein TolA [Pseudomonadota bacterium]